MIGQRGHGAARACMKVQNWPARHRELWLASLKPGDPIDGGGGSRTSQRAITNRAVESGYGRFLTFLAFRGMLDPTSSPADGITPEAVRVYVAELQRFGNKPGTIHVRLQHLREMAKVFDPLRNWDFIARAMARVHALRHGRDPFSKGRLVTSDELLDLGIRLMEEARGLPPQPRALAKFRDGLLIAFLSIVPLRLKNLAELALYDTLVKSGNTWVVTFQSNKTKTHLAMEYPWPEFLITQLEEYISSYRTRLLERHGRWRSDPGRALWISLDGSAMGQAAIGDRLMERTRTAFGFRMRAHAFRHAAVTTIAIDDPAMVGAGAPLLGHSSYATTGRAYNVAKSIEATRAFATVVTARQLPRPSQRRKN